MAKVFDAWICYSVTELHSTPEDPTPGNYIGRETEFRGEAGVHRCPRCKGEDVFPYRMFECIKCKHQDDQDVFFPEWPADEHPLKRNPPVEAEPCPNCKTKDGLPTQDPAQVKEIGIDLSE